MTYSLFAEYTTQIPLKREIKSNTHSSHPSQGKYFCFLMKNIHFALIMKNETNYVVYTK
jgi:hypothetical protein